MTIIDKACYERGCACYDDRLDKDGVAVVALGNNKVSAWMMAKGYATGHGTTTEDLLQELEWQIAEREREACAKVCEELHPGLATRRAAEIIRARGNQCPT